MTELLARAEELHTCPSWCANRTEAQHAHVSEDVMVEASGGPLVARLVSAVDTDRVSVLINDRVADVEEARSFAHALQRLTEDATLAEPGLGFIATLAARSGLGVAEMALSAGLDASWVRAQQAGGRVLTVREFDRLALGVARAAATASALGRDQD
jgi:hypothetical protein